MNTAIKKIITDKPFLIKFCLILLAVFPLMAQACWPLQERKEIEGFSELDEVLIVSFKDAVDCQSIADAEVLLGNQQFKTDKRGYVQLPMGSLADEMDAAVPVQVQRQGYVSLNYSLKIEAGTVLNKRMVMSRVLPAGKIRFVLQWHEEPRDLDLHLKGPGFHISYRNMKDVVNKAKLDRDALHGYGPETITLHHVEAHGVYSLWVDNYSNEENFTGLENVMIYSGNRLIHNIPLNRNSQRAIRVLNINQSAFEVINEASSSRP